jgi:two-component system osmolarity sensor histidine kinase EnvZ
MRLLPQSAFGQTVVLIGGLLLINQIVTYLSVTYYFIRPSYQQINTLVASQVDTIFLEELHKSDNPKQKVFTERTGTQFHTPQSAMHAGLRNAVYYDFMSQQISKQLGGQADVRVATGSNYLIWIKPPQYEDLWISIPMQGIEDTHFSPLTLYLFVISILSVAGGWLFVRRLNRPLQALQKAARQVGKV